MIGLGFQLEVFDELAIAFMMIDVVLCSKVKSFERFELSFRVPIPRADLQRDE